MRQLKRVLSFKVILLATINAIMGVGIFFLPAIGLRHSGPASIFAWLILTAISLYIAMMFSEMVAMFPKAGSIYEYTKHAYGRFLSFLVGWVMFIASSTTIALLIVGAITYLMPVGSTLVKITIALLFIIAFNYISYKGMKTSSVLMVAFAIVTFGVLAVVIFPAVVKADIHSFKAMLVFPASAIFLTLFFILETFFGWESATNLAEEVKDAEKVMPKALIIGTAIIGGITGLVVLTMIGTGRWVELAHSSAPLADVAQYYLGAKGRYIVTLGTYLALMGTVAVWVISAPRLVFALTRDRLFLPKFKKIHPVYNTPHYAILFQAIISTFFMILAFGSYDLLLNLLIPLDLFSYSFLFLSLLMLRIRHPKAHRPFKAPFGKTGAVIFLIFNVCLVSWWLFSSPGAMNVLNLLISIVFIGFPIYFLLEMYYNPKTIRKVNNYLSSYTLMTEGIYFPLHMRKEILAILGNMKKKSVLEFGCSVGTLTQHLASEVGKEGSVYATDLSENHLMLAQKRMNKQGNTHVHLLHDQKHDHRVHPKVPKVDYVVSVGVIGYTQNVKNVLKGMNQKLEVGGSLCIVDYDKYFHLIPNIDWLSNDTEIIRMFHNAGFTCRVERKKGWFWQYIYIYGKKFKDIEDMEDTVAGRKQWNYVYDINKGIFNLGKVFVERTEISIGDGIEYMNAQFRMKNLSLAKNYFFESYFDAKSLIPEQFRVTLYQGREATQDTEMLFKGDKLYTMKAGGGNPDELDLPEKVQDIFSALMKVRKQKLEVGKRFAIDIAFDDDVSTFIFEVKERKFVVYEDIAMNSFILSVDFKDETLPKIKRVELYIADNKTKDIMMAKVWLHRNLMPLKIVVNGETGL